MKLVENMIRETIFFRLFVTPVENIKSLTMEKYGGIYAINSWNTKRADRQIERERENTSFGWRADIT